VSRGSRSSANGGARGGKQTAPLSSGRARLLAAGEELLADRRYEDVSSQEITARAGVANGLLFHHFGTKRDFFLAVLEHVAQRGSEQFGRNDEPDPAKWLRKEVDLFLTGIAGNGQLFAALMHGSLGAEAQARDMVMRVRNETVERILTRLRPQQRTSLLVGALMAWIAASSEVGAKWVEEGRRVPKRQVQVLLVDMMNAALRSVAVRDPGSGIDPEVFAGAAASPA
jgi:AcrR family transcriptional regulator